MKKNLLSRFRLWWLHYARYVQRVMGTRSPYDEGDVAYWRELSFVKIVLYLIPVSIAALIPRLIFSLLGENLQVLEFDVPLILIQCLVLLSPSLSARFKKIFAIGMLYVFSIVMLVLKGSTGPGIIYMTSTCVFTVFLFKGNKIYYSVIVNCCIIVLLALNIRLQVLPTPLNLEFNLYSWLNYGFNLLFINLAILVLIQRIIRRLEKIILAESELQGQLADEALEVAALNNKLKESDAYYRYLFSSNPSPMWVFDIDTLKFLQVNDAALKLYGYSREEFMEMTIKDIRPESEVQALIKAINIQKKGTRTFKGSAVHMKKNKKTFPVAISSNEIAINGRTGRLVLAMDITERVKYINSIEEQNNRIKHIAWIQSHKVRAPLARVMSLSSLLAVATEGEERKEIIHYLTLSANELNEVITSIIKQAEEAGS